MTTHGTGQVGCSALTAWILGLQLWHMINGAPWNGKEQLTHALKGAITATPHSTSHPPCHPITIWLLQMLYANLDLSNMFDASVYA